ncbi:uncharacterized protein TEOVI_000387200 [Trypanosoma equiperdum]|uniref:T. brucei spp.-specific protein n=2 Tax=Trypanozoon TaxID=39700 RepID=Q38EQ6_TRYB2|nr:hypothetical protein, unlikely [Trypanosoma brucei brucei TREU927]EAN76714.1 hypothetical protein, unlikely [Trypanosoma brucei brucei TREU927]SCU72296.1 hypothetical protein, conserved [Trypanosoma equiperdum]
MTFFKLLLVLSLVNQLSGALTKFFYHPCDGECRSGSRTDQNLTLQKWSKLQGKCSYSSLVQCDPHAEVSTEQATTRLLTFQAFLVRYAHFEELVSTTLGIEHGNKCGRPCVTGRFRSVFSVVLLILFSISATSLSMGKGLWILFYLPDCGDRRLANYDCKRVVVTVDMSLFLNRLSFPLRGEF